MAASLQGTAQLASDPLFQQRVQAAMITAAIDVAAESIGSMTIATYQARHTLATAILQGGRLPGAISNGTAINPWLSQFSWACAANVTISGEVGPELAIEASTADNPAKITTAAEHGLSTGDWVEISGHLLNTPVNGSWQITVVDTTSFTIPVEGETIGAADGEVNKQPPDGDIQFACNSVFSNIAGVGTV
jgi:hypothetical protein